MESSDKHVKKIDVIIDNYHDIIVDDILCQIRKMKHDLTEEEYNELLLILKQQPLV